MNAFCKDTGRYIPAPHKEVKRVPFVGYSEEVLGVIIYDQLKQPIWLASLVHVVIDNEFCCGVETKNSVYVGKPA